jgi:hypothetical protein
MSGPINVIVVHEPIAVLLAQAAIEAMRTAGEAWHEEERLAQEQAGQAVARRQLQDEAMQQGERARRQALSEAQARFDALAQLAGQLGLGAQVEAMRPAPPKDEAASQAEHTWRLNALSDKLGVILNAEAKQRRDKVADTPAEFSLPAARQGVVQRQLERIAHLGEIPQQIQKLAQELEASPPGERAELLANELRRQVQLHLEADQRIKVQKASAVVIEQTLLDLGYQVEEIAQTLFVEGGVVHFRRAGWGDYMVRMRADNAGSLNFNVVRAVEAGANERSSMDHIAEDRWCAEFPLLLRALQARGIGLDVKRRLAAGELPVQLVDRNKLPAFAGEQEARPRAQPKARELK